MSRKKSEKTKGYQLGADLVIAIIIVGGGFLYFSAPTLYSTNYTAPVAVAQSATLAPVAIKRDPNELVVTHIPTPVPFKALYMTNYVAGVKNWRESIVKIIDTTELNSVVIDIKDYTGRIGYEVYDPELKAVGAEDRRIPDIRQFIDELHKKHIYVVGRIAVFQDPYMVRLHPDWAVKKASDKTAMWKDYKGISWIEIGATPMWDYIISIAKDAYAAGFDELNFDYVRFPSDGNMSDIYYPHLEGKTKAEALREFFEYVHDEMATTGAVLSVDLFGMTTTNNDDLNIGQKLENALPYFDYVMPMVYPSHYPTNFIGYKNPAAYPYEVVKYSMGKGVLKAEAASSSPLKLRPWLQDFNLGAVYTPDMVRAQMKATYDVGLDSWALWNAANQYISDGLLPEEQTASVSSSL
ncbi:putative glycoside hydrolase [Candidatus Parcubacteria bacterium]|nr:putative glycoside hydrolase [Candidatus Parcubacteria bacterium]